MSATAPPAARLPRTVPGWLPFLWNRVLFPGTPDAVTRVRLASLALVVLLPAALLYPCRGFMLLEPDEGRYAQIPKEMLDRGEWVVPTLQGEPYLDKPPLMYWLVTLSYRLFGVNEAAARLVPAVCVHLTILAVYLIGRRSIGERGAMWAALLLSVSPGYLGVARLLLLDGLLTLCVTTSMLCGFEAVRGASRQRQSAGGSNEEDPGFSCRLPTADCQLKWGWWLAAATASGLGFLTKGPISEVLLFPPLLAFGLLNRPAARVGWKPAAAFAAVVVAVNTPWYVAIYLREPEFLRHFFWDHNVMRFLQPFDHLQPVWYYVPILLGGFLPGVIVGVAYLRSIFATRHPADAVRGLSSTTPPPRHPATPNGGFWLLAGLWCVFFFSCSGSKLPTYILPAFPPLCLALGEFVARTRWNVSWATPGMIGVFAVFIGVAHSVGVPWYATERSPMGRPELVERFVTDPTATVVTYPRNVDSVAFYTGRNDLRRVRSQDVNQLIVDSHFRPRTVVLFTHAHSAEAFRHAIPPTLRVAEAVSLKRTTGYGSLADKLVGATPWGLCDIAVLEPVSSHQVASPKSETAR